MRIALDIETDSKHSKIWLCVTKDIDTGETKVWKNPNGLNDYLNRATRLIGHNGLAFDFYLLNKLWKTTIGRKKGYDTLVVSRLLEPTREQGHSLEAWGEVLGTNKIEYKRIYAWLMNKQYVDAKEFKNDTSCYDDPHWALLEFYCIRDVDVLEALYRHLEAKKEELGFSDESVELEHQVAAIVSQQERNGFKLDTQKATMLLVNLKGRLDELYEWFQQRWPTYEVERVSEKTGKLLKPQTVTFNPGSRQQIGEKLKELGWKPEKFTETGQPQVDEKILEKLPYEEAKLIAEYLLIQKRIAQIESWMEALGDDGRVHGRVITNGAVTGRMTHHSPNMGQVPNTSSLYGAECREVWTVEEDSEQVGVDLSGIELRCLAHYMQDKDWQNELLVGDVHWKNTQAFGLVPMGTEKTEEKEHKDARNLSKTLCYSVLYGAGPAKVGLTVGKGAKEGAKLIDNFMRNTPALKKLINKVAKYAVEGYVPGLDGRKVWVRSEHAALNSLLQSAGAIIAKKWIVIMEEDLRKQKIPYKLLAVVHDEVQLEVPKGMGDVVGKIAVEAATKAGEALNFRCPVSAEYRVGRDWHDCH